MREARRRAIRVRESLEAWWTVSARDLPWRFGRTTPWGVLVSEVMSQQTPMGRVVPYWEAWMRAWPDAAALAAASTAEVITAWGRLGYPRRALRLQECARVVGERHHGELPKSYDALTSLPGVGDYTASAVMSFAYGERVAVVDTNIRRVLSRVFLGCESLGGTARRQDRELAAAVLPDDRPDSDGAAPGHPWERPSAVWNQAVMELGALVCTARGPLCDSCPLRDRCAFLAAGRPGLGEGRTRPRQRFQGTDRQVRGKVLAALRELPVGASLERDRVRALWPDAAQLDSCVASLDDDGLVRILPDGGLGLPL